MTLIDLKRYGVACQNTGTGAGMNYSRGTASRPRWKQTAHPKAPGESAAKSQETPALKQRASDVVIRHHRWDTQLSNLSLITA